MDISIRVTRVIDYRAALHNPKICTLALKFDSVKIVEHNNWYRRTFGLLKKDPHNPSNSTATVPTVADPESSERGGQKHEI